MSTHYFQTMDEAYQISLKVEEKLNRKWQQNCRGNNLRGKGTAKVARGHSREGRDVEVSSNQISKEDNHDGRGKGKYVIACYRCGVEGHKASECLEKHNPRRRNEARTRVMQVGEASAMGDNVVVLQHEEGENLMFNRVLLKLEKKIVKT